MWARIGIRSLASWEMSPLKARGDAFERVRVFDLDFVNAANIDPVCETILQDDPGTLDVAPVVVTPNTDILLQYRQTPDEGFRSFFSSAWLILPDGQPIVWASRLLGSPLRARLCGSDLFAALWPRLVQQRVPTVVLASSQVIADGLAATHDRATITVAPMIDAADDRALNDMAVQLADQVTESDATVVILCLGHPKDSLIAARLHGALRTRGRPLPYVLCLGGSAEMYLGVRRRAPRWVQRLSAEWLYRFAQEPRRLFRRYVIEDVGFIKVVASEWRAQRGRTRSRP